MSGAPRGEEVEEAPGASVPFSLEPIMAGMEGGHYTSPILPALLANLVTGRRPAGGSAPKGRGGSGGSVGVQTRKTLPMVAATGGSSRVRVRYDVHLPSLSRWYRENLRSILTGAVLPTLCGHVLCKNWHMCGVCWED